MTFSTALLVLSLAQSVSAPHPQAPAELSKLAFFVGAWDLNSQSLQRDGSYTSHKARSDVYWALDGMALIDEFRSIDANGDTVFRGLSFRTWDVQNQRVAIKWVMANSSGMTDIQAKWKDGELHMEGRGYDEGGEFLERARYYEISVDSYRFELSRSYDNGEHWVEGMNLIEARRIE